AFAALGGLIGVRQVGIHGVEVIEARQEGFLMAAVEGGDHAGEVVAGPILIGAVVERAIRRNAAAIGVGHGVDAGEDLDVIGNGEAVAAVLVAEQVVEIVKARPGNAGQAERAGFVGREEQAIPGVGTLVSGNLEKAFDGVHF